MSVRISTSCNDTIIYLEHTLISINLKLGILKTNFPYRGREKETKGRREFLEYLFKNCNNIMSIMRRREDSIIIFGNKHSSMSFEPLTTLLWRKFSEGIFYKLCSSSVFRKKFFFIRNTRSNITTTTTRYNHLLSWMGIFFKYQKSELLSSY